MTRTIVFTRTKRGADRVAKTLEEAGVERRRHPRQQEPGPARAGARRVPRPARRARWSPPTSPRAASTSTTSATSSISSCPTSPRPMSTASAAPRAPARRGQAISLCDATERDLLRAIERLTRLRIFALDRRGDNGPKPAPVVRKAEATPAPDRPHHSPHRDPRSAEPAAASRPPGSPHAADLSGQKPRRRAEPLRPSEVRRARR